MEHPSSGIFLNQEVYKFIFLNIRFSINNLRIQREHGLLQKITCKNVAQLLRANTVTCVHIGILFFTFPFTTITWRLRIHFTAKKNHLTSGQENHDVHRILVPLFFFRCALRLIHAHKCF